MIELYLIGGGAIAIVVLALMWKRSIRRKAQDEIKTEIRQHEEREFRGANKKMAEITRPVDVDAADDELRDFRDRRGG